jgi:hypothetical protein
MIGIRTPGSLPSWPCQLVGQVFSRYAWIGRLLAHTGARQLMTEGTRVTTPSRTLVEGQRLDQPAFHALYVTMPPGTRAELIDGPGTGSARAAVNRRGRVIPFSRVSRSMARSASPSSRRSPAPARRDRLRLRHPGACHIRRQAGNGQGQSVNRAFAPNTAFMPRTTSPLQRLDLDILVPAR